MGDAVWVGGRGVGIGDKGGEACWGVVSRAAGIGATFLMGLVTLICMSSVTKAGAPSCVCVGGGWGWEWERGLGLLDGRGSASQ